MPSFVVNSQLWLPPPSLSHSFSAPFSLATWNGQGLFCFDDRRCRAKLSKLRSLALQHDITVLQEAHCNSDTDVLAGTALAETHVAFWPPGPEGQRAGGVGALLRRTFKARFHDLCPWQHIEPGCNAKLSLRDTLVVWTLSPYICIVTTREFVFHKLQR